jgi:hypothetical protein
MLADRSQLVMLSLAGSCDILKRFSRQFFHNLATTVDTYDSLRISRQLATDLRQPYDMLYREYSEHSSNQSIHTVAGRSLGNDDALSDQLAQVTLDVPNILVQCVLQVRTGTTSACRQRRDDPTLP